MTPDNARIAVIGLGYVGLPLAVAFGTHRSTVGFDINAQRIRDLRGGADLTREVTTAELQAAQRLRFSSQENDLTNCNVYVIAVPTPVTESRVPDFGPVLAATRTVAPVLRNGDIVVYESTVYPGATEEICRPLLEQLTGLRYNKHFYLGYSPERANPGDREHRLATITKVVSGSTPEVGEFLAALYGEIVPAGIHLAPSIAVAEAAKVIENVQRDINVALVNELAMIFSRLGLDTEDVLKAAGTKWNFLPFTPGLVGGHCIGVDPYYLTYKAQAEGYHPEMILAGRRINDGMGRYIVSEIVRLMLRQRIHVNGARVLIMGVTFKENCPDIRNTRVVDIVHELALMDVEVDVHDPWADADEVESEYGITLTANLDDASYDAAVIAVAHDEFRDLGAEAIRQLCKPEHIVYDVKHLFPAEQTDGRL